MTAEIAGIDVIVPVLLLLVAGPLAVLAGVVRLWRRRAGDGARAGATAIPRALADRRRS